MKLDERCFDCLLSRVALECDLCGADPDLAEKARKDCAELLAALKDKPLSHPEIASAIHRLAYSLLESHDPFIELKEEGNRQAIEVCMSVRDRLSSFRDYVLAAVIGNTFDYGVRSHQVTDNFRQYFDIEFEKGLYIDDTDRILELSEKIVFFTDNCGEIVFDRLLLEYLHRHGSEITLAVRDSPILNDATMKEVRELRLDRFCDRVTTTGCGAELGVRLDCMPPALESAFSECTLVIAKGMANYESLSLLSGLPPVAYLMAVKCDPIAEEIGVPRGVKIAMLWE